MAERRGIERSVSVPILAGCLTGCWWPFGLVAILMVLDPWAPLWLKLISALGWLAAGGFVAARFVRPWFALLVLAVYAPLFVYSDQTAWSDVQPSFSESWTTAGKLAAPWLAGALLDLPRRARAVAEAPRASAPQRTRWAELMRRVFALDVLRCEHCGGRRKLIALIQDPFVARRILEHLGLPSEPPPVAPARAPPQGVSGF